MPIEDAVERAIHECIRVDILKDFLANKAEALGDGIAESLTIGRKEGLTAGRYSACTNGNFRVNSPSISIILKMRLATPDGRLIPISHASTVLMETPM